MIRAIWFDIDDTLLDFEAYVAYAMESGFDRFGLPPYKPEMLAVFHRTNNRLWQALERGEIPFETIKRDRWNLIFRDLGFDADGPAFERYFREVLFGCGIKEPGAEELLRDLEGRYLLCAASNGPAAQQRNRLRVSGLAPYFDALFISEEMGIAKPADDYYRLAFARLNVGRACPVKPSECLMVGDSPLSDIAGGLKWGMKTCLYARHAKPGEEKVRADHKITSLSGLYAVLEEEA